MYPHGPTAFPHLLRHQRRQTPHEDIQHPFIQRRPRPILRLSVPAQPHRTGPVACGSASPDQHRRRSASHFGPGEGSLRPAAADGDHRPALCAAGQNHDRIAIRERRRGAQTPATARTLWQLNSYANVSPHPAVPKYPNIARPSQCGYYPVVTTTVVRVGFPHQFRCGLIEALRLPLVAQDRPIFPYQFRCGLI